MEKGQITEKQMKQSADAAVAYYNRLENTKRNPVSMQLDDSPKKNPEKQFIIAVDIS